MIHVQDTCHTALHGTLRHSGTFHIHTVRGQSRWSTKQRISMKNTENSFEKYIQEIYTSKASYHVRGWFNNICNGCDVNDDKKYIKNKCSSFRSAWVYIGGTYPIWIPASVFRPLTVTNSPRILRSAHTFPARTVPVSGPLN